MDFRVTTCSRLRGTIGVPGDKSISHRALMIASLADGNAEIHGISTCADVESTMRCLRALGVQIDASDRVVRIYGKGLDGLKRPMDVLDAGNSGTTIRLLSGLLAGRRFTSSITGDESLRRRPMRRIIEPLRCMGAKISGLGDNFAPLTIEGGPLKGTVHHLPVASAQVKSCLLFAGMFAEGKTTIVEPFKSRDHTERLLSCMGANITVEGLSVTIGGSPELKSTKISVPGDISSSAFFMVAASVIGDSELTLENIGVNPTRTGLLDILREAGGSVSVDNSCVLDNEPRASVSVRASALKGVEIGGEAIPKVIDEIPVLAVAATQAHGQTIIRDARELRVKETDRIEATVENLRKMGANVEEHPDGMVIEGEQILKGAEIDSYGDHRIGMAFAIAGLIARGETLIHGAECVDISYPGFFAQLEDICYR